jgi:hypothetical protein
MSGYRQPIWAQLSRVVPAIVGNRGQRALLAFVCASALALSSCSPRDFLSRRLAADLIATSGAFQAHQEFGLHTGVLSNKDYASAEYLVLQHRNWISATSVPCTPGLAPPPCWDVILTPLGVDTVRTLVSAEEAAKKSISIPVAKREFIAVTGISNQGSAADVEFTWKWAPLNEVGAALYSSDLQYKSSAGFRKYDDGWRVLSSVARPGQSIEEALKNAEPVL